MATFTTTKPFLGWHDIAEMFGCGRSKALLLMHAVGVTYVGNSVFVRTEDLYDHLEQHGSIDIEWPKSAKRRKAVCHD